jgi:uncharacterized protein
VLILLPPSETKRDGGHDGTRLRLSKLGFRSLAAPRKQALASLTELARNPAAMALALKLGPHQDDELLRNRRVARSPVLCALDRYTGVLYEALDAHTLSPGAREFASEHLAIHSALFGLLRADDLIPAYRLSAGSRLPGLSMGKLWRAPISAALAAAGGLILDLRSEAYAKLGPAVGSFYLRVVSQDASGTRRALGHFNKKGKGLLVRSMLQARIEHPDVDALLTWADRTGIRLTRSAPGELELLLTD